MQCKPLHCWLVQVAGVARICHGNSSPPPAFGQEFCRPAAVQLQAGAGALFAGMWRPERSQSTFNPRFCQAVMLVAGGAMLDVETNCCSAWDNTNLMLVNITITTPCTVIVFSTLDYRTATAFN